MTETIKLSQPIQAHDEEVTELKIRVPKGGDIMDLGMPFQAEENGTAMPKPDMIAKYISKLSNIPVSSVRSMGVVDFMQAQQVVAGFFDGSSSLSQMQEVTEKTTTKNRKSQRPST